MQINITMDRYLLRSFIPSADPKVGVGGGEERGAGYVHSPESTTNHECTLFIKYPLRMFAANEKVFKLFF